MTPSEAAAMVATAAAAASGGALPANLQLSGWNSNNNTGPSNQVGGMGGQGMQQAGPNMMWRQQQPQQQQQGMPPPQQQRGASLLGTASGLGGGGGPGSALSGGFPGSSDSLGPGGSGSLQMQLNSQLQQMMPQLVSHNSLHGDSEGSSECGASNGPGSGMLGTLQLPGQQQGGDDEITQLPVFSPSLTPGYPMARADTPTGQPQRALPGSSFLPGALARPHILGALQPQPQHQAVGTKLPDGHGDQPKLDA